MLFEKTELFLLFFTWLSFFTTHDISLVVGLAENTPLFRPLQYLVLVFQISVIFLFALFLMLSVAHHLVISLHFTWSLLCLCSLELLQLHKHSTSRFQNQMAPTTPSEVAIFTLLCYNPLNFIQEVLKDMLGFTHNRMILCVLIFYPFHLLDSH